MGIEHVVLNILHQPMPNNSALEEILVVASGCTDRTEDVVRGLSCQNGKVKLIAEKSKKGKASAINLILHEATGDILVFTDADVFPASGSFLELIKPFKDNDVGAVGGRPLPLDDGNTFWGFVAHLIWTRMQNELLTSEVRRGVFFQLSGYLCAIRHNLIDKIPSTTIAEDKFMGEVIRQKGYKVLYAPQAIVYLHGPRSLRDFLLQRERVLTGHLQVKRWFGLREISTSTPYKTVPALVRSLNFLRPKELLWAGLAATLECCANLLARYNLTTGKLPYNWRTIPTTKLRKTDHVGVP